MGSVGIPKSQPPYVFSSTSGGGGGGDCSEMICTRNCLRWCPNIFPPPPPPDDDSGPNFSPLIIVIITVLASALFFVTFYTVCTSCARRRRRRLRDVEADHRHDTPAVNDVAEIVKKQSRVFKYRKVGGGGGGGGGGAVEVQETECPVCLAEFEEDESLRLLPKCSHVFHLVCIDTWVKSQPNCPICRASVVLFDTAPAPAPAPAQPLPESTSQQENSR